MKHAALLVVLAPVTGFATDVSGDQTGVWVPANNPYRLVGDVRVPPGGTLTIQAGVQVVSAGFFKVTVDGGTLMAQGTAGAPVTFTATDHVAGWRGLRFLAASNASRIDHCLFEYAKGQGAYPEVQGGAVIVRNCSPTIQNSTFQFNSSMNSNYNGVGAGVFLDTSNATVANNVFKNNQCDSGAGVCVLNAGSPLVVGNLFDSNTSRYAGGGMYLGAGTSPTIDGNWFFRNSSAGYGGGAINSWTSFIYYGTFAIIRNNLMARNTASTGAAVYCRYDRALLTNNTIVNNSGSGVYALNYPAQAPIVTNCVIWGNTGGQVKLDSSTGSAISLSYCDVQGGYPGTGNLSVDPRFVKPSADDYHLAVGSPCVDAGDNAVLGGSVRDLDGLPRFVDDPKAKDTGFGDRPLVDMGAFERQAVWSIGPRP